LKLIVGLGNPGPKYELTRHNIGFIIIDLYADSLNVGFKEGKGDWFEAKFKSGDEDVFLLRPMTYMNNSGSAVREFAEKHEVDLKDVLVIVDDFQIPLGMIRVRKSGSDGGHNGLSDIIYQLNSDEFSRMRIGIGKSENPGKDEFIDFVLGVFDKEEIEVIKKLMPVYFDCINSFVNDGITKTMNTYNKMFI
jgi:PTH1 family peptidyl-tRNA hydrolase